MGTHPALRGGGTVDDTAYVDPTAFIAGSATVGARTFIGAGAFVAGGVHVGSDCIVCGGVQVLANVPNGTTVPCPPTGVTDITPGTGIAVTGTPPGPLTVSIAGGAGGTNINYFQVSASVAGKATAPNWDRYRLWGQLGQGQANSGQQLPDDTLFAIPQVFNRSGTITDFTAFAQPLTGTANLVLGVYSNHASGEVFPGSLVGQSPEITFPPNTTLYRWSNVGVHVVAGNLVWMIYTQKKDDPSHIFQHQTADAQNVGTGLLGSSGIGGATGFPGPSFDVSPIQQSGLTLLRAYNATLPATFPQVGTFATIPTQTTYGAYMPSIAYRFVAD
jgi:hypothetical protein